MDNHEFRSVSGSDSYTSAEHNAPELWLSIPTADDLDIISGDPDFQEFVRILEDDGVDLLKPGTDEGVLVGSGDGAATYPNDLQDTQHSSATHVATFSQLSTIALGSFDSPLHTNGAYLYDAWNLPAVSSSDINVPNSAVHHYLAESYPIPSSFESPVYQYESNDFQQPMPVTSGLKKTLPDFVEGSSRQPEELEERIDPPFSNPSSRITLDISHSIPNNTVQPSKTCRCGAVLSDINGGVRRHLHVAHRTNLESLTCPWPASECSHSGKFAEPSNLVRHIKEHHFKLGATCQRCGDIFHNKYSMTRHLSSCRGEHGIAFRYGHRMGNDKGRRRE